MTKKRVMCSSKDYESGAGIVLVKVSELHDFKDHPFKVEQNQELFELRQSMEKEGVLVPLLIRHNTDGDGYEIIAGHRRKAAAIWAGMEEVPAIIRDLDDDQSIIAMVDSNLQREKILPSEKAFAYKMRLEAMKHQGRVDDSADADGQYMVLKFWSYETFDKDAVNQMKVGDVLLLRGEPRRIDALKRSENSLGETTCADINGDMAEDGITLAYDYEENCFREEAENDAYVLYSVGSRKVKLAADFLYADHSSVANPGDPEPEWAKGDAAAFPDYIAGRELYGNNSYAQIRGGELAELNIE